MPSELTRLKDLLQAQRPQAAETGRGVMVAHSAGIDSTALFHILLHATKDKARLALCHVNFGLRGEDSDLDEAFVRATAAQHGVELRVLRVTDEERAARRGESVQEWARRLRYEAFARWAKEGWVIALAHHADDVAETVLQRLARGASSGALLGMAAWTEPYWRPLLPEKKSALTALLATEKIPHREDASNAKLDYSRNVIRHSVLPELEALHPGAADRLVATAREAAEMSDWVRAQVRSQIEKEGEADLAAFVRKLPRAVALTALTELFHQAGITHRQLSRRWLGLALDAIHSSKGEGEDAATWTLAIPGGGHLHGDTRRLWIDPVPQRGKRARSSQHDRALAQTRVNATLEPGSHAFIRHGDRIVSLSARKQEEGLVGLSPAKLRVYVSSAGKSLRFKGSERSWRLGELVRGWGLGPKERLSLSVVEQDEQLIGVFDGDGIAHPLADGRKARQTGIELRYWPSDGLDVLD